MLTVDVGNSSIGVGRWTHGQLDVQRFTVPEDAADFILAMERSADPRSSSAAMRRAAISVSAPRLSRLQDRLAAGGVPHLPVLRHAPLALRWPSLEHCTGSDRLANAVAILPGPAIAVDAGTAVTIDLVDDTSTYCGGFIAPGPAAALLGLARSTAALPQLPGRPVPIEPGCDTESAIAAGGWGLLVGGVDRLVSEARTRLGVATRVVVTGAWGADWMHASGLRDLEHDAHLVHRGILAWAERADHAPHG